MKINVLISMHYMAKYLLLPSKLDYTRAMLAIKWGKDLSISLDADLWTHILHNRFSMTNNPNVQLIQCKVIYMILYTRQKQY